MDIERLFLNKQFVVWGIVFTALFVATVSILQAFDAGIMLAVVAGIALKEVTEPVMNWFIDWRIASEEVQNAE